MYKRYGIKPEPTISDRKAGSLYASAHVTLVLAGSRKTRLVHRSTPGPPSLRYHRRAIGYLAIRDGVQSDVRFSLQK